METKIFHANNCALYFVKKNNSVLINGLYCNDKRIEMTGMSVMPRPYADALNTDACIFSDLDFLLFTHKHADHYDTIEINKYRQRHKNVKFYAPGDPLSNICTSSSNNHKTINVDGLKIDIIKTDHLYIRGISAEIPHSCYMLTFGEERFFIAADAVLNAELYHSMNGILNRTPVICAFINIMQLLSQDGQEFIKLLAPKHLIMYHVPEEKDDAYNYLAMIKYFENNYPEDLPHFEIAKHMDWFSL